MTTVEGRVAEVRRRIAEATRRAGRAESSVVLIGASKRQALDRLQAAWAAGVRVFGENRVQEALEKQPLLPPEVDWHLIGPLQSNKAKRAATAFSTVHSIDRVKIARALDRHAGEAGRTIEGLLEVNLGEEESKHGFSPTTLLEEALSLGDLEHLRVVGLMAIPPFEADPAAARRWFGRLRGGDRGGSYSRAGRHGAVRVATSAHQPMSTRSESSSIEGAPIGLERLFPHCSSTDLGRVADEPEAESVCARFERNDAHHDRSHIEREGVDGEVDELPIRHGAGRGHDGCAGQRQVRDADLSVTKTSLHLDGESEADPTFPCEAGVTDSPNRERDEREIPA